MAKPQIHIIEEQIARKGRNVGKVKDRNIRERTNVIGTGENNRPDNSVKWRRISFNGTSFDRNYGLYHTPVGGVRDFVADFVSDSLSDTGITATDAISSRDVTKENSIISESSIPKGEHIIYMTTLRVARPTVLPIKTVADTPFGLTAFSIKIDLIYWDGNQMITENVHSSGQTVNAQSEIPVRIPQNTDVTLVIYTYNGVEPSSGPFYANYKLDTAVGKLADEIKAPVPFAPQDFSATTNKPQSIDLSWNFDPFVSQGDNVRIQRGEINSEGSTVEKWKTIAILNGYTVRYTDLDIKQGQRYFYKAQYISPDSGESRFSNTAEGIADYGPYSVTLELEPNDKTGLVGYYRDTVRIIVRANEPIDEPIVVHTSPGGNKFTHDDLRTDDGGFTWKGAMRFVSPIEIDIEGDGAGTSVDWKEGKARVDVFAPIGTSTGQTGDPLSANTGGGTVVASQEYIIDKTRPKMASIYISNDDDRVQDTKLSSTAVFVFTEQIVDDDANALTQGGRKEISGVYQIQFTNDNNNQSAFGEWQEFKNNFSYPWRLLKGNILDRYPFRTVYARVRDRAGNVSDFESASALIINYYPTSPTFTTTGEEFEDRVVLSWTAPTETGLKGYKLYKSQGPAVDPRSSGYYFDTIEDISINVYSDSDVSTSGEYNYAFKVFDEFGVESLYYSTPIYGLSPTGYVFVATGGPSDNPITDPTITGVTEHWSYLDIGWTPNTEFNFKYYNLYRATSNDFDSVDYVITGLKNPVYRDPVPSTGTEYFYWVTATNEGGSEFTTGGVAEGSGTRKTDAPTPPIDLSENTTEFGYNYLTAGESSSGLFRTEEVDFINIYRASGEFISSSFTVLGNYELVAQAKANWLAGKVVFQDKDVQPGEWYNYAFTATNFYGYESATGYTDTLGPAKANYKETFINLVDNGDFSRTEVDNTFSNWNTDQTPTTLGSGEYRYGEQSFLHSGGTMVIYQDIFCQPNRDYYLSMYAKQRQIAPTIEAVIEYYEPGASSPVSSDTFSQGTISSTTFARYGWGFTTPATATYMRLIISGANTPLVDDYYLDGVQIEESGSDSPKPFVANRSLSADRFQAHFIQTDMLEVDTVQGRHLQAETVSGREILGGSITADKLEAGSIGTRELAVGFGTNLVFNGSFLAWESGGAPPGWTNLSNRFEPESTYFQHGGRSVQPTTSLPSVLKTEDNYYIAVDNSRDYTISFYSISGTYAASPLPTGGIKLLQRDSDWNSLGYATITTTGGFDISNISFATAQSTGYERFWGVVSSSDFDPSTAFLEVQIGCSGVGTFTSHFFDAVQLELGREPTPFEHGGITTINGGMIQTKTIDANHIIASSITATELAVSSVNASKIVTSSITVDKLSTTFGGNLVVDGAIQRWTQGSPDNWQLVSSTNAVFSSVQATGALFGETGLSLMQDGVNYTSHILSDWIKVPRNSGGGYDNMNISFYCNSEVGSGRYAVKLAEGIADSNGDPMMPTGTSWPVGSIYAGASAGNWSTWQGTPDTWKRFTMDFNPYDATNGFGVNPDVEYEGQDVSWFRLAIFPNYLPATGWMRIDGIQVTVGSGAEAWKPNEGTVIQGNWIKTGIVQSYNYTPGSAGWGINIDGGAEFSTGTFRGGVTIESGATILGTANIVGNAIVSGEVESQNYVAGLSGWQLNTTGGAEFSDVTIRGTATIYGDAVVSGSLKWGRLATEGVNLCDNGGFEMFNGTGLTSNSRIIDVSGDGSFSGALGGTQISHWYIWDPQDVSLISGGGSFPKSPYGNYIFRNKNTNTAAWDGIYQQIPIDTGTGKNAITISYYVLKQTNADPRLKVRFEDANFTLYGTGLTVDWTSVVTANKWEKVAASFAITGLHSSVSHINICLDNSDPNDYQYIDGVMVEYTDAPDWSEDSNRETHLGYASPYRSNPRFFNGNGVMGGRIQSWDAQTFFDLDDGIIRLYSDESDYADVSSSGLRRYLSYESQEITLRSPWYYVVTGEIYTDTGFGTPFLREGSEVIYTSLSASEEILSLAHEINGVLIGAEGDWSGGVSPTRNVKTIPLTMKSKLEITGGSPSHGDAYCYLHQDWSGTLWNLELKWGVYINPNDNNYAETGGPAGGYNTTQPIFNIGMLKTF